MDFGLGEWCFISCFLLIVVINLVAANPDDFLLVCSKNNIAREISTYN